ncbi:sugar ABC transporter substrate-binding protein [Geodermatophilus sp. CPCC 205506]|uniref:sugar ABC transporter substrate-binding protein n=1 Tax=Geodermatophilus sp. CPCC 205506 TaxID=2936596 RepID=UPI003EEB1741
MLVAAGVVVAACGGSGGESQSGGSDGGAAGPEVAEAQEIADQYTEAPTEITQTEPLPGPPPSGMKVVFASSAIPATQLIVNGAGEAAEALGWEFDEVSYDGANPATIQAALRNALTMDPDAVIIVGNPPSTYGAEVLASYEQAGVPLVVGSVCPLEVAGPLVPGSLGCEAEATIGRAFANWFIADSNGAGKALFENVKAIPTLTAFVDAFRAEVEQKCPECQVDVLEATLTQVGANEVVPAMVNRLRQDPSYTYAFFDNANFAKGIGPALSAAGLADQVSIGGRSIDDVATAELRAGRQAAWTAVPYNVGGYGNIDAVLRALMDAEGIEANDVPPFQIVTPDNVDSVPAPYRNPEDALEQYLQLWGVS